MENWGLITYRVVDVMLDEKTSGASTKERVAEVVQHECKFAGADINTPH